LTRIEKSLIQSEAQMTQVLRQSPKMVWGAFGLSLLSWVGIIFEYGLSLAFLGLDLSLNQVLLLLVAARIAILLPLPAGIGTLESSQILGLSLLGLETAIGLSITLVIRARDVLLGLIGVGWGWYKLRGERRGENFS
ncbi:MAG: lysylphosphatidylglycerol synthase domain-containing protein, partial [Chloroflexota bacterium]